jgi:hypothetical protein
MRKHVARAERMQTSRRPPPFLSAPSRCCGSCGYSYGEGLGRLAAAYVARSDSLVLSIAIILKYLPSRRLDSRDPSAAQEATSKKYVGSSRKTIMDPQQHSLPLSFILFHSIPRETGRGDPTVLWRLPFSRVSRILSSGYPRLGASRGRTDHAIKHRLCG